MNEDTWSGELAINIAGLSSVGLGKIHLVKLEEVKPKTVRVCPQCGKIPKRLPTSAQYRCEKCKKEFKTWHSLKQAIRIDEENGLPIPNRDTKKIEKASVSLLDLTKARGLVTKTEYAIISLDEKAKSNMQKLGVMIREFKKAVVFELVFQQKGTRHLFYITVNDDNSLRAREIVPINKVKTFPKEIEIFAEDKTISGKEIRQLMDSIPEIKPEELTLETEYDKLQQKIEDLTPAITDIEKKMKEE